MIIYKTAQLENDDIWKCPFKKRSLINMLIFNIFIYKNARVENDQLGKMLI